jgi:hypothetical protein
MALIEDFSYFNSPFDYQYTLGSVIDSTLYYYTQKPAQRALLEQADAVDKTALIQWSSYDCFETALADFHLDLLQNPWLRTFPFLVRDVALFLDQNQQLQCMDKQEQSLPIQSPSDGAIWQLLATSGGQPVALMAEWNGQQLTPMTVLVDSKFIHLGLVLTKKMIIFEYYY